MRILACLVAALMSATIGLMLAATFWPLVCPLSLVGSSRCEDAVVFVLPCCWLLFGIAGVWVREQNHGSLCAESR